MRPRDGNRMPRKKRVVHAVGERKRAVPHESANTATWAARLADALEALVHYER